MLDPRTICQLEIPVTDVARAARFYEDAFGWRAVPADIHEYVVLGVPEDCPFGIALVPRRDKTPATRAGPTVYFAHADPEVLIAKVVAAGGVRRLGPLRVAGYGAIWQVEDPDGNRFGLYSRSKG